MKSIYRISGFLTIDFTIDFHQITYHRRIISLESPVIFSGDINVHFRGCNKVLFLVAKVSLQLLDE